MNSSKIRLWSSADKAALVTLPQTWNLETQVFVPGIYYVEGMEISGNERDIDLRFSFRGGSTTITDTVHLTVLSMTSIEATSSGAANNP